MSSLVPRLPPSFLLLEVHTANDGKLDRARGTRLMVSYELSCMHMPQAACALSQ